MTNPLVRDLVDLLSPSVHGLASSPRLDAPSCQRFSRPCNDLQCRDSGLVQRSYGISGLQSHCGLMPANLITLPHFSVSSTISLPNWAGDPGSGVPPRSASRALILGSASATLISLFSFSTMSAGVFLGAPTPVQKLDS